MRPPRFFPRPTSRRSSKLALLATVQAALAVLAVSLRAGDGTWTGTASGNWGTTTNWSGGNVADGAGFTANLSTVNIGATVTVTLDTPRTIGTLLLGDTNSTNNYVIAGTGLNVLTFDNGASNAVLNNTSGSSVNSITAAIALNSSLDISNNATSTTRTLTLGAISAGSAGLKTVSNLAATGTGPTILSGNITDGLGTVAIVQNSGTSVLTISGTNSYTGGVTLTQGTLNVNSATALGATASTLVINGGRIDNSTAAAVVLTMNNAQQWNASFVFGGTQSLNLGTGAVTMGSAVTLNSGANTLTVGGAIGDGGNNFQLTKTGNGSLTLNGTNTFGGGLTLSAGTLNLGNAAAVGTGTFTIGGGTFNNTTGGLQTWTNNNAQVWNASFTFTGANSIDAGSGGVTLGGNVTATVSANNLTVAGVGETGGARNLAKSGGGTLILNGNNTYTGTTTVNAGTLLINGSSTSTAATTINSTALLRYGTGATLAPTSVITINAGGTLAAAGPAGLVTVNDWLTSGRIVTSSGGALAFTANDSANVDLTANGGFNNLFLGAIGTVTYSGVLTPGTNGFRLGGGGGTLIVTGALNSTNGLAVNGNTTLTGHNHYRGATTVTAGLLNFAGLANLGVNPVIALNGGGLQFATGNAVDLSVRAVSLGTGGGTLDTNGNSVIFANAIGGGAFALTKTGAGMLTLNSANIYTGATAVAAGALRLGVDNALAAGAGVTLGNSSTTAGILNLNGHDQTVTTLDVKTNSATAINRLQITRGNTFANTGNVTIGQDTATGAVTRFVAEGGGTWNVSSNAASAAFQVGGIVTVSSTNTNTATADLSALSAFNLNLGATTSVLRVGDLNNEGNSATTGGSTLILAPTSTVTVARVSVGADTATSAAGVVLQTLSLGAITNTFNTDSFEVGASTVSTGGTVRGNGVVNFAGGTGAFTLRAKDGTSRVGNFYVMNSSSATGVAGASVVNLAGHDSDLLINNLVVAGRTTGVSTVTGTMTFDTGKLNVTTAFLGQRTGAFGGATGILNIGGGKVDIGALNMARNTGAANSAFAANATLNITRGDVDITTLVGAEQTTTGTATTATGTINISGDALVDIGTLNLARNGSTGTTTSVATAGLNVSGGTLNIGVGGLILSSATTAGSSAIGTMTITGGRVTMAGNITDGGGAGTSTSTLVLSGGVLDLGGNNLGGAGSAAVDTVTVTGGTLQNVNTINSTAGLTKTGAGTLTLAETNNWTGATTLNAGTTVFSTNANLGSALSAIVFGGGGLRWASGNTLDLSASRNLTFTGAARLDTNGNNVIFNNAVGNSGAGGLIKSGNGKLTLRAANTYTGTTTFRGGTLTLDFTGSTTGATRLPSSGIVANGGTLEILGTDTAGQTTTVTTGGLSVGLGAAKIVATSQAGNSVTLDLGAISRTTSGGTVDFTLPAVGSITTATANANPSGGSQTILGGYATVGGNTWAVSGSSATAGVISGLAVYNAGFAAGTNVDANIGASGPVAMTINSLRFNNTGAYTVSGGALTIGTGGLLVTSNVGANAISIANNLTSGNGLDLVIIQNNAAGTLTISSVISGSIGLTKSGAGLLVLGGTNTYTGSTVINEGKISISNDRGLGAVPGVFDAKNIILNGGTLLGTATTTLSANRGMQIGENGGTLEHTITRFFISGIVADVPGQVGGALTLNGIVGAGDIVLGAANTYSGGTILNPGSTVIVNVPSVGTGNAITSGSFGTGAVTLAGGSFRAGSAGNANLANALNFAADTTIPATGGALIATGAVTLIGGNRILTSNSASDVTFSGVIGEDGSARSLTKAGTGRVILNNVNTFSGGVVLNGGILNINGDAALGARPATNSASNLAFTADSALQLVANTTVILAATRGFSIGNGVTATFDPNGATGNLTILGAISGAGGVKTGTTGTVVLANSGNTYQGGTTLNGSTLIAAGDGALGSPGGDLTFTANSTLQALGDLNLNDSRDLIVGTSTATLNPNGNIITVNGNITGSGAFTVASASGLVWIKNSTTFNGVTNIGTAASVGSAALRLAAGALGNTSGFVIGANGGDDTSRLELATVTSTSRDATITLTGRNNSNAHIENISGANKLVGGLVTNGTGTQVNFQSDAGLLTLEFSTATNTRTVALDGAGTGLATRNLFSAAAAGGLVKNGTGTWTITAAQTNAGNTTVNNGTLLANNTTGTATGTGAVTVSGGAIGGTGTIGAGLSGTLVNGAGVMRPGDPTVNGGIGKLTVDTGLELEGSTAAVERLILEAGASNVADFNDAAGLALAVDLTTYLQSQAATYESQDSGNHDRLTINGGLTLAQNGIIRFGRADGSSAYTVSPVAGDVYDLYDWTGTLTLDGFTYGGIQRGGGLIGDLDLPTLTAGLSYDMTLFQSNGIVVVVVAVPEPTSAALLLLGSLATLGLRRRRKC